MRKSPQEIINELVESSKTFPNPVIQYNFDELPKDVKPDSFYGVKANFNKQVSKGNAVLTYKMS